MKIKLILLLFLISCSNKTKIAIVKQREEIIESKKIIQDLKTSIDFIKKEAEECNNINLTNEIEILDMKQKKLELKIDVIDHQNKQIESNYILEVNKYKIIITKQRFLIIILIMLFIFAFKRKILK